jgi:CRP-like cAMP-binding protein
MVTRSPLSLQAYERSFVAGDVITERWGTSQELYVLMEGTVDVVVDGRRRDQMAPGDFFGELAALDWGAGFSYPRLATVIASSDVRLLVLPGAALNRLYRESPEVSRQIDEAIRRRLPGL